MIEFRIKHDLTNDTDFNPGDRVEMQFNVEKIFYTPQGDCLITLELTDLIPMP